MASKNPASDSALSFFTRLCSNCYIYQTRPRPLQTYRAQTNYELQQVVPHRLFPVLQPVSRNTCCILLCACYCTYPVCLACMVPRYPTPTTWAPCHASNHRNFLPCFQLHVASLNQKPPGSPQLSTPEDPLATWHMRLPAMTS